MESIQYLALNVELLFISRVFLRFISIFRICYSGEGCGCVIEYFPSSLVEYLSMGGGAKNTETDTDIAYKPHIVFFAFSYTLD